MRKIKVQGLGFLEILLFIFITLKLTGVISWSWLWVLSPIWVPAGLIILIFSLVYLFIFLNFKDVNKRFKKPKS